MTRNSLRIGVSPDNTLAYIDFLYDDATADAFAAPLCDVGQPRLPAAFRIAGLGSYFTPWHLDTNDVLLQAVSSTDVASSFIDEAWVTFVVELNTVLRTIRTDALHRGISKVARFLARAQASERLGGVLLELCTFPNFDNSNLAASAGPSSPTSITTPAGTIPSVDAVASQGLSGGDSQQPSRQLSREPIKSERLGGMMRPRSVEIDMNNYTSDSWEQRFGNPGELGDPAEKYVHFVVGGMNLSNGVFVISYNSRDSGGGIGGGSSRVARLSLFSDSNNHRGSIVEEGIVNDLRRMFSSGEC